jgi:murein L,D-transpeptidase YcbB/YkuD
MTGELMISTVTRATAGGWAMRHEAPAWWSAAIVVALAGTATFAASPMSTAGAEESAMNWIRFGGRPADQVATLAYDRQFVRQWEANPPRGYPTISRKNIDATRDAIERYRRIVKEGGWGAVAGGRLEVGLTSNDVRALQERLIASGEFRGVASGYFDYDTERALKRFQATNGLTPTGVVDARTRTALNVPAQARLKQLQINLNRLRSVAQSDKHRYVVVNIPAAQIEAVEDGRVVSRHSGVVGKRDRRTPILASRIHELNFNPVWRLPPTVVTKDLIPKGRQMARANQNVLKKFGIDAYEGGRKIDPDKIKWNTGQPYRLSYRQQPGEDNPLGFVKINFHNQHSVYLHDTPSDRLFGRNFRAASSGCVRVQKVEELITWLLRDTNGWSINDVHRVKKSGKTKTVRLKRSVPLQMVYLTAWATEDGVVQFRRDLYHRDGVGQLAANY